jgi:hypothetical protein
MARKITTEETKRKIGDALRGRPSKLKGRKLSEETKRKMSEVQRRPHSEETKRKISESCKGHIKSDEHRKKMSESHKGMKYAKRNNSNTRNQG